MLSERLLESNWDFLHPHSKIANEQLHHTRTMLPWSYCFKFVHTFPEITVFGNCWQFPLTLTKQLQIQNSLVKLLVASLEGYKLMISLPIQIYLMIHYL